MIYIMYCECLFVLCRLFFFSALEEKMISTKREYLSPQKISDFLSICNLVVKRDSQILNKIYHLSLYLNFVSIS